MRIVLTATEYSWRNYYGGIKTYTQLLAAHLAGLGHEVHVITDLVQGEERHELEHGVFVHSIGTRRILPQQPLNQSNNVSPGSSRRSALAEFLGAVHLLRRSLRIRAEVQRIAATRGVDIVEAPDWGAEGLWLGRRMAIPVVVTLHGPRFWIRHNNHSPDTIGTRSAEFLEKRAILGASALVSPSAEMRRLVAEEYRLPVLHERIRVIPNPIDTTMFTPGAFERFPVEDQPLTITYVGRLEFRKGLHVLAAAVPAIVKDHPGVRFRFIGSDTQTSPDSGSMHAYLSNQLQQYLDVIEFYGPLPNIALPDIYRSSTIVVLPSLHENLPYTCAEAMSCGACVVASEVGGFAEIVQQKTTGYLVPPGDAEALAQSIIHLLAHPEERRELGARARTTIQERMSIESVASKKIALYEQLIRC